VTGPTRDPAALLRGTAAAGLTAALAVAAHTTASGALPTGAVVIALAVVAGTVGVLAATVRGGQRVPVLAALLGGGQLLGHTVLEVAGHGHAVPAPPSVPMWLAHGAAVALGATLIACGARLCAVLSRAVRVAVRLVSSPPGAPATVPVARDTGRALPAALAVLGSVRHRGPPVSFTS
jgi:hypothetical protein